MLILSDLEILNTQKKIKLSCENDVFEFFDNAKDLIHVLFPKSAVVCKKSEESHKKELSTDAVTEKKLDQKKSWISDILEMGIKVSTMEEYNEEPPAPISLPFKIARRVTIDVLKILATGRHLSDNGLIFIGDVGEALKMDHEAVDTCIEQVQYDKRKEFTQFLLEYLTESQRYWVALMLYKAIHADNQVHPLEYKYFENIIHLLGYDQMKLNHLYEDFPKLEDIPRPLFEPYICAHIFKYIVEIVMIDEEYAPEEAKFIKDVGASFGYDKQEQDEIIQPVASALMTRRSLFSY